MKAYNCEVVILVNIFKVWKCEQAKVEWFCSLMGLHLLWKPGCVCAKWPDACCNYAPVAPHPPVRWAWRQVYRLWRASKPKMIRSILNYSVHWQHVRIDLFNLLDLSKSYWMLWKMGTWLAPHPDCNTLCGNLDALKIWAIMEQNVSPPHHVIYHFDYWPKGISYLKFMENGKSARSQSRWDFVFLFFSFFTSLTYEGWVCALFSLTTQSRLVLKDAAIKVFYFFKMLAAVFIIHCLHWQKVGSDVFVSHKPVT